MIILTDQADVSGAAFMQTKAAKDLRVTLNPCHVGTRRQRERVFIATFYPDRVDDVEGTMLKLMECRARNDLWSKSQATQKSILKWLREPSLGQGSTCSGLTPPWRRPSRSRR